MSNSHTRTTRKDDFSMQKFRKKIIKKVLEYSDSISILKRYFNQSLKNSEKNWAYTKTICEKRLGTSFIIPTCFLEPKIMDSVSFNDFSPMAYENIQIMNRIYNSEGKFVLFNFL